LIHFYKRVLKVNVWERGWMEEEGDKVNTWAGHRLIKDVLREQGIGEGVKE
jgi:hypothetical protein